MIAAFVPEKRVFGIFGSQGLTLLAFYLVGVSVAVPTAWLLKRTILKGQTPPFLMALPAFKTPSPRTVAIRVYQSGLAFVKGAGTIILAVSIIVWALSYFPRTDQQARDIEARLPQAEAQHQQERLQALNQHDPRRFPLDLDAATRDERLAADPDLQALWEDSSVESDLPLGEHLAAADRKLEALERQMNGAYLRDSYMGRMGHSIEPLVTPLGWDWRIGMATIASFPAREIIIATLGVIFNLGNEQDEESPELIETLQNATWPDGRPLFTLPVALSIMIFFALCAQCAATLATVRKETGHWGYAVLSFAYMTTLAYLAALAVYQGTTAMGW